VTVVLVSVNFNWGALIGPAFMALFFYRFVRNRKKRRLAAFTKKIAKFPEVRLIVIRENHVTIVIDKAPAKVYIRITALIEELNQRLYVGRDVTAEVKSEIPEAEVQTMLRKVGVVYAREDKPVGGAKDRG
jgi:hypothetical protein